MNIDYNLIDKCVAASKWCVPLIKNDQQYDVDLINKWIFSIRHELSFECDAVQKWVVEHLISGYIRYASRTQKNTVREYANSLGIMTQPFKEDCIVYDDIKPNKVSAFSPGIKSN